MERMEFDLLFRWFVGLGVDDPVWDHSSFSKNRDRLLEGEIAAKFLARGAGPAEGEASAVERSLLGGRHADRGVGIDQELPAQGRGRQRQHGPGRNAERNFHKEKRSNETHRSITDPEARLYKKGDGQPAKLCYTGPCPDGEPPWPGGRRQCVPWPPARPSGRRHLRCWTVAAAPAPDHSGRRQGLRRAPTSWRSCGLRSVERRTSPSTAI